MGTWVKSFFGMGRRFLSMAQIIFGMAEIFIGAGQFVFKSRSRIFRVGQIFLFLP